MLADTVGLSFAAVALGWSILLTLKLRPLFSSLLDDLGGQLSAVTQTFLKPWVPLVLGGLPVLIVGDGILRAAGTGSRKLRMDLAIFLTLCAPVVFFVAIYLPLMTGIK